jgi:hypothetical protein
MPPPKSKSPKAKNDIGTLISLTQTTQDLLAHFQSSLAPQQISTSTSTSTPTPAPTSSSSTTTSAERPNPLDVIKATVTLLRSHTTTLSLLLINPPLTPSALITKIGDVSAGVLSNMVAAASDASQAGEKDPLGKILRSEIQAQVRRLLGAWGEVLGLVLRIAERKKDVQGKDTSGPTESEKQDVLATTGMVWEACDALLKLCQDGVVGLVVKKAEQYRSVLLDAVEELKEWGEDVADGDEDEDGVEGSDGGEDEFEEEDEMFSAANKLGKGDKELREVLDTSVKRLKTVGILYQALIKRRLKTFPASKSAGQSTNGEVNGSVSEPMATLDQLMAVLKQIPDTVDDLASAFYDLDEEGAKQTLDKCCREAKSAAELVKQSWTGQDDEFTAWSAKCMTALEGS